MIVTVDYPRLLMAAAAGDVEWVQAILERLAAEGEASAGGGGGGGQQRR